MFCSSRLSSVVVNNYAVKFTKKKCFKYSYKIKFLCEKLVNWYVTTLKLPIMFPCSEIIKKYSVTYYRDVIEFVSIKVTTVPRNSRV